MGQLPIKKNGHVIRPNQALYMSKMADRRGLPDGDLAWDEKEIVGRLEKRGYCVLDENGVWRLTEEGSYWYEDYYNKRR